jgi:hypothetical protein
MKRIIMACLLLTGCAGFQRDCNSTCASNLGADWIVLQYGFDGVPINCWKLSNVGITNETQSDGIYWLDSNTGHLVHISGWYNRVQVSNRDYEAAAKLLGVEANRCHDGKYETAPSIMVLPQ